MSWPGYTTRHGAPSDQPRFEQPEPAERPRYGEPSSDVDELIMRLVASQNGRQAVADALWARIPAYVEEFGYVESGASVIAVPQTKVLERITFILAVVPSGTTASLILGQRIVIPLVSGINNISPCSILLQPSDPRSLQLNGGATGTLALLLTGEQAPPFGKI